MKVTYKRYQIFQPIEMSITFESIEELAVLYAMVNLSDKAAIRREKDTLRAFPELTLENIEYVQNSLYNKLSTIWDNLRMPMIY